MRCNQNVFFFFLAPDVALLDPLGRPLFNEPLPVDFSPGNVTLSYRIARSRVHTLIASRPTDGVRNDCDLDGRDASSLIPLGVNQLVLMPYSSMICDCMRDEQSGPDKMLSLQGVEKSSAHRSSCYDVCIE